MRFSYSDIRAALRYRDDVLSAAIDDLARQGIYTDIAGFLRDHADDFERDYARQMLNVLKQLPAEVVDYLECRDRLRLIEPAIARYDAAVTRTRAARRSWQTRAARLRQLIRQADASLVTAQLLGEATHRQRATLARRRAALAEHTRTHLADGGVTYEEARAGLAQLRPERAGLTAELARLRPAYRRYFPATERGHDWRDADRRSLRLTPADWRAWDAQCMRWRAAVPVEDFHYDQGTGLLFREGRGPVTQRTVMCRGERVPVNWLVPWLALDQDGHRQADVLNLWVRPQCPYAGEWKQGYWWRWSDVLAHPDRLACHSSGAYSRMDDGRPTPPDVSFIGGWHWYMKDGRIIAPGIGLIEDQQIVQLQF